MNIKNIRRVIIVGAGFSKYAGLPLQSEFTKALLTPRHDSGHPDHELVKELSDFIHGVFDHSRKAKSQYWPDLEDIFTAIDLSANSGHHLGGRYPPSGLRNMRRALLARIVGMLDERSRNAASSVKQDAAALSAFFTRIDPKSTAFICMNWDTVIEQMIKKVKGISLFDYGCKASAASFSAPNGPVQLLSTMREDSLRIVKMHGSTNWLYCDNCRQLYWFPPDDSKEIAKQLRSENGPDPKHGWQCHRCRGVRLTTRIATFSYLKALDFPMFQRSWLSAEDLLRNADKWVFIGYSLPAADYEFKYLLKRVQLSHARKLQFVVITGGSNTKDTYKNYQRFFGRGISREQNFFSKGLVDSAISAALQD